MGDKRLLLRECEAEVGLQPGRNRLLDVFGVTFGASEPQQPVISVADIAQAAIGWVVRVERWQLAELFVPSFDGCFLPPLFPASDVLGTPQIGWVMVSLTASCPCWQQFLLDVAVEAVEVNVAQNWGSPAL